MFIDSCFWFCIALHWLYNFDISLIYSKFLLGSPQYRKRNSINGLPYFLISKICVSFFFGSSIFLATVVAWRWHEQHHGLQKHYIASHLLTSADEWRYWGCVQGSNSSFNIFLQCDCQALSFSFTVNGSFLSSLKIHFSPSLFYLDLIYFMSLTERYGSYNCCCQCLQIRLFEPCVLLLSFVDFSSAASRSPVLLSPAYL